MFLKLTDAIGKLFDVFWPFVISVRLKAFILILFFPRRRWLKVHRLRLYILLSILNTWHIFFILSYHSVYSSLHGSCTYMHQSLLYCIVFLFCFLKKLRINMSLPQERCSERPLCTGMLHWRVWSWRTGWWKCKWSELVVNYASPVSLRFIFLFYFFFPRGGGEGRGHRPK